MDWTRIPSLSSLRAFDALARRGSLSAAARDLNVTHAAIAQHLRKLEDHFGEPLAHRDGQTMRLTETGEDLALSLNTGFTEIGEGVTKILDRNTQRPIMVTLTPTFAESWLMPRIGQFWEAHPDIQLHLNPSVGLVDYRRDGIDLGIRFGAGSWPGLEAEPLVLSKFVVVAAPDFTEATRLEDLGDLTKQPWFYSPGSKEHLIWGKTLGLDFVELEMTAMPSHGMVLSAARSGLGLAVVARMLVESEIQNGLLKVLYEDDPGGLGYHIVNRPGIYNPGVETFRKWLKRAAQAQV